ncbi:MAG: WG repeat-containing protein [Acidobacteria bacterium]|nr:WG repeat-containing protein [Acidobacteriota bacterium]
MRSFNWRVVAVPAIVLILGACSGSSSSEAPSVSGVPSEVLDEPGEAPATRLFAVTDPGDLSRPVAEVAESLRTGPLKMIDEDGNTFAAFVRESGYNSDAVFSTGNLFLTVTSVSGERLFIDMVNKKKIVNPKVLYLSYFSGGLAVAKADEKAPCGWADDQGNMRIAGQFADCGIFHDGAAIVQKTTGIGFLKKTFQGILDTSGAELLPPAEVERIQFIGNGRYAIFDHPPSRNGVARGGIFDVAQKRMIPLPGLNKVSFNSSAALLAAGPYGSELASYYALPGRDPVALKTPARDLIGKNLYTYSDGTLTVTTPDGAQLGSEKIFFGANQGAYRGTVIGAQGSDKVGVFGENGKWVLPPAESQIFPFTHGWAQVRRGDHWRIVDLSGKTLLEVKGQPLRVAGRFIETAASSPGQVESAVFNRAGKRIYGFTVKNK